MINKNVIRYNFNLKISKLTTRINYSFVFKKYLKSVNSLKFIKFYNNLIKNKRKFKKKIVRNFSSLLSDRKISLEILKQYKNYNPFKRKRFKKIKNKKNKKKN